MPLNDEEHTPRTKMTLILIVLLLISILTVHLYTESKRTKAYKQFCKEKGLQYRTHNTNKVTCFEINNGTITEKDFLIEA